MAILKHKTSKNKNYTDVLAYYTYQHDEHQKTGHYEPILDENGLMIERERYAVTYITAQGTEADPEMWAAACMRTNLIYEKNMEENDIKNHEYIIAHPKEDIEKLTDELLLEEGKAFARKYLRAYDVLIAVHDGQHIHITANSIRAEERGPEKWMQRNKKGQILTSELVAGGKHQHSAALNYDMHEWLKEYTQEHGFTVKDNNAIAAEKRQKRHKSKNDQMREALLDAAGRSKDMKELRKIMKNEYNMDVKASKSGNTISVLYPGNEKYVRLRTLGLEPADLTRRFGLEEKVEQSKNNAFKIANATEKQKNQFEITEEQRRTYYEIGRIAGMDTLEIDRLCEVARYATYQQKQQLWSQYKKARDEFWEEYNARSEALAKEINAAYKRRRRLKEIDWVLSPYNRHSSLLKKIIALIIVLTTDTTVNFIDIEIEQLKREREELIKTKNEFKAKSKMATEVLREKDLNLDAYIIAVKQTQTGVENLYKYHTRQFETLEIEKQTEKANNR